MKCPTCGDDKIQYLAWGNYCIGKGNCGFIKEEAAPANGGHKGLAMLLQEGLYTVPKAQDLELDLSPADIALIETGIERMETIKYGRKLTELEREIYYSAFCSAFTVAGQVFKSLGVK